MTPPSPNQERRKALSFLPLSLALTSSSSEVNEGFATGDRRIIEALSLLLLPLFLSGPEVTFSLVEDEGDEPKPCPGELVFLGGTVVSLTSTAGFDDSEGLWALIVKWVLVRMWRWWRR